jgi:hypothetical protein
MEEKIKYLELVEGSFTQEHLDKQTSQNPYTAYSIEEGKVIYNIKQESPYKMVDLGLSVKWADRNVGASSPEDTGLYFDWGNVDGHTVDENGNTTDGYSFNTNTYATTLGGQYTGSTLDAEHDAATVNMGSDWRMPTVGETVELVENTDHYYIGENGSIVDKSELSSSKKLRSICFVKKDEEFDYDNRSNFIEFPFAGYGFGSLLENEGLYSNVWSSSAADGSVDNGAHFLYCSSNSSLGGNYRNSRFFGYSVRGVHA